MLYIDTGKLIRLGKEGIEEMPKIFQAESLECCYACYYDSENSLRICLEVGHIEIAEYFIYEIKKEEDEYYLVIMEISDIGFIHGHAPEVFFGVARLPGGSLATTETEAIEFMIVEMEKIFGNEKLDPDISIVKEKLRAALLPVIESTIL